MPASANSTLKAPDFRAIFSGLLEASPDAVLVLDTRGMIVLASKRVGAMYGYDPAALIGKPMNMLMPERLESSYQERFQQFASEAFSGDLQPGEELFAVRRDGTEFPVETSLSPYFAGGEQVVVIAIRDITERTAIEARLRQAQKMEAIGTLTGGLAHDFNNLLGIVIGNLDLLHENLTDPALAELATSAQSAALRGADLTQRLLAFAGRQPLQPKEVDVNELVSGFGKMLGRTMGADLAIEPILADDVWPVTVDPVQLEASIVNLVTNARDAMPEGGRLLLKTYNRRLDADYASLYAGLVPGDYAMIEVTDSGIGMSPETLAQIFEPFFTTKREGRGTGLGLSMVFGFVKQSGGHINVYSEVGVGTTFRLFLPRGTDGTRALEREEVPAIVRGGTETILAVEDNPSLRGLVVRQLTQLGYRCFEAATGNEALRILAAQHVDLLFSDVLMPGGMNGVELGRKAQARRPQLKLLLTSGFPEEKFIAAGAPGGPRLLSKPYRKDDLARTLREILDQ